MGWLEHNLVWLLTTPPFNFAMLAEPEAIDWAALSWPQWRFLIDLLLILTISTLIFWRLSKFTPARPLIRIGIIYVSVYLLARFSGFELVSRLMEIGFLDGVLCFIVLFQPEIRRALLSANQGFLTRVSQGVSETNLDRSFIFHELSEAIRILSKRKVGALIVIESENEEHNTYLEIGIPVQAKLSSELLLTIFHPNTPLHDGAVILNTSGQVVSAGVLLPLSENPRLSWEHGTRHRAAVGLSEISESQCIIVSEETGKVSLAKKGVLTRLADQEAIENCLKNILELGEESDEVEKQPSFDFIGKLLALPGKKKTNSKKTGT